MTKRTQLAKLTRVFRTRAEQLLAQRRISYRALADAIGCSKQAAQQACHEGRNLPRVRKAIARLLGERDVDGLFLLLPVPPPPPKRRRRATQKAAS